MRHSVPCVDSFGRILCRSSNRRGTPDGTNMIRNDTFTNYRRGSLHASQRSMFPFSIHVDSFDAFSEYYVGGMHGTFKWKNAQRHKHEMQQKHAWICEGSRKITSMSMRMLAGELPQKLVADGIEGGFRYHGPKRAAATKYTAGYFLHRTSTTSGKKNKLETTYSNSRCSTVQVHCASSKVCRRCTKIAQRDGE